MSSAIATGSSQQGHSPPGPSERQNRLHSGLGRERVVAVELRDDDEGERLVVDLARPERRVMACPGCGYRTRAVYDRAIRTWRHLDCLRTRVLLRCEVRRIDCPTCGVVTEQVPFARPGSRFTRAFEDTAVWLTRDAPKSVVARLMRVDWATVGRMLERVVAEHDGQRADRLDGLRLIGIDEVAYRKGRRYLTCVVDHETGALVWCSEGRSGATLARFFIALGPERCAAIEAVSVDMGAAWPPVLARFVPGADVCIDPFHVIKLASEALDGVRRAEWQRLRREDPEGARWLKGTRFALRRRPGDLSEREQSQLADLRRENALLYDAWLMHDQLRAVFSLRDPVAANDLLGAWIVWADDSGLAPFRKAAATIAKHFDGIIAAVRLGISNARLEAMNSTVRLMSHRSCGFRRLDSLVALMRLVCGRVPVVLPT